jgi:N-methylhydantoinase A
VDTGGTFTDFVAIVDGRLIALKLPSTPVAPERAVLEGLSRLGAGRGARVRHGSTVATNALLERKGARVVFVTTAGFEDLLEIGRQDRPQLYALAPRRVPPLVPAGLRLGVAERIGPRGEVLRRPAAAAVARAVAQVRRRRPEAIAIGLLHAYANPAHERALERALARLGVPVCRSSALSPEIREYERFATTVTNAYLMPRVSRYLEALARGTRAEIEVVLSHGGSAPPAHAAREPARQLLSGPAAGLEAAQHVARACGFPTALTLDVGGTSTDCAFVAGALSRRRGRELGGFPIQLPVLDVHTVGAGGGSIAAVDAGGMLRIGPESAGAVPGPACYGRGGPPTVTDALVVLGRIPGERLAGGSFPIVPAAAFDAMRRLGRALGRRDAVAAAEAVITVADAKIEAALRRVSVEEGHDPRGAALVAFGGAGGLHACAVAAALGGRTVLFPRHAGVLSALGALAGAPRHERSRSVLLDAGERAQLEQAWRRLEAEVRAGFPARDRARVRLRRFAEMRYAGQSHELSVAAGPGLAGRFHREHQRRFGFAVADRAVEVVTVEVRGEGADRWTEVAGARARGASGRRSRPPVTAVRHQGRRLVVPVLDRTAIPARLRRRGPAIVIEEGATLWVPPGWSLRVHRGGTLIVERGR